jgi:hypothetical protein
MKYETKNFLVNSGFETAQRIVSGNQTLTTTYGLDRWWLSHDHTSVEVSRQDISTAPGLIGLHKYGVRIKNVTRGAGTGIALLQPIETESVLPMVTRKVVFSVYLRKSSGLAAGNVNLLIKYVAGVNADPATILAGTTVASTAISYARLSGMFKRFLICATVPATAKTIAPYISLTGSPTDGQHIEATQACLNIGTEAMPWQRAGATQYDDYLLCLRSCFVDGANSDGDGHKQVFAVGKASSTTLFEGSVVFPVPMRKVPTPSFGLATVYQAIDDDNTANPVGVTIAGTANSIDQGYLSLEVAAGLVAGNGCALTRVAGNTTATIVWDAEL